MQGGGFVEEKTVNFQHKICPSFGLCGRHFGYAGALQAREKQVSLPTEEHKVSLYKVHCTYSMDKTSYACMTVKLSSTRFISKVGLANVK